MVRRQCRSLEAGIGVQDPWSVRPSIPEGIGGLASDPECGGGSALDGVTNRLKLPGQWGDETDRWTLNLTTPSAGSHPTLSEKFEFLLER